MSDSTTLRGLSRKFSQFAARTSANSPPNPALMCRKGGRTERKDRRFGFAVNPIIPVVSEVPLEAPLALPPRMIVLGESGSRATRFRPTLWRETEGTIARERFFPRASRLEEPATSTAPRAQREEAARASFLDPGSNPRRCRQLEGPVHPSGPRVSANVGAGRRQGDGEASKKIRASHARIVDPVKRTPPEGYEAWILADDAGDSREIHQSRRVLHGFSRSGPPFLAFCERSSPTTSEHSGRVAHHRRDGTFERRGGQNLCVYNPYGTSWRRESRIVGRPVAGSKVESAKKAPAFEVVEALAAGTVFLNLGPVGLWASPRARSRFQGEANAPLLSAWESESWSKVRGLPIDYAFGALGIISGCIIIPGGPPWASVASTLGACEEKEKRSSVGARASTLCSSAHSPSFGEPSKGRTFETPRAPSLPSMGRFGARERGYFVRDSRLADRLRSIATARPIGDEKGLASFTGDSGLDGVWAVRRLASIDRQSDESRDAHPSCLCSKGESRRRSSAVRSVPLRPFSMRRLSTHREESKEGIHGPSRIRVFLSASQGRAAALSSEALLSSKEDAPRRTKFDLIYDTRQLRDRRGEERTWRARKEERGKARTTRF
ncbi:hypothetical protein KM043_012292 [Ampulex compressa]|nr:hypothetical protein KM043_012292 [Ampulex compressa]